MPSTVLEQRESESAWRQLLVQGVLAVLLPTEDLENGCLRALVAEIFAELILGNGISGKACEGWLLWEGITRIAEVLHPDGTKEKGFQSETAVRGESLTRLERSGLLDSSTHVKPRPSKTLVGSQHGHESMPVSIPGLFWAFVQYAFLACTAARAVIVNLATTSSLPLRSGIIDQSPAKGPGQSHTSHADTPASRRPLGIKRPIVSMKLWSCVAQLAEMDVRMPWLLGFVSMFHRGALVGPGRVGETDGVLDR